MTLQGEVERIDQELAGLQAELVRLEARRAGLHAERERLSRALAPAGVDQARLPDPSLRGLSKTDAIITVLGQAGREMTIDDVVGALRAAGRSEENYGGVSIYLGNLVKDGRVRRVRRGHYAAS